MYSYKYFHIFGSVEYDIKFTVQILKDQWFVSS
jgi:hypothetical protein